MGDEASEGPIAADRNTPPSGHNDVNGLFAALLEQMKSMNQNFASFCSGEAEDNSDQESDSPHEAEPADTDEALETLLNKENESQPDVIQDIADDLNVNERTDPAIHEELGGIFNTLVKSKMSEEKLKDKYVRPENVKDLRVPKINPLVWNQLTSSMRSQDSKSQKSQGIMMGSIIASIKAADLVMKKYPGDRDLLKLMTDSVAMGLHYNHEVNQSRRMAMKKELHKDYASLCNVSPAENGDSEFLFGDLSKITKDIAEANKLTKRVRPTSTTTRGGHHGGQMSYANKGIADSSLTTKVETVLFSTGVTPPSIPGRKRRGQAANVSKGML